MTYLFFIYGLSFFVMGFSLLLYPKRGSAFKLARHLWLIAGFGLLHGLNEWLDMFILIREPAESLFLAYFRMITLPLSFLCLVQFGAMAMGGEDKKYAPLKLLSVLLAVVWALIFVISKERFFILFLALFIYI